MHQYCKLFPEVRVDSSSVEHSPVLHSAVENVAEATTLNVLIICLFFLLNPFADMLH